MRVIAGKYRGIKLETPTSQNIRPTMDRSKEGLFNIINMDIINKKFLDLFSGTGNVAIEAISRGAIDVTAVDNNKEAIKIINNNVEKIKTPINIVFKDVELFLTTTNLKFDYIFMDPPYEISLEKVSDILNLILEKKVLNKEGKIIIELKVTQPIVHNGLETYKFKKYGKSSFSFIKEENE